MLERKITVTIEPTPAELAFVFCNFCADKQADFFNEVAVIVEKWKRPFCFQLQYVTDNERLTLDGRRVMEAIGEYGQDEHQERTRNAAPALLEALEKAREDINWMLNSRQFLNADVFNYIDAAIASAKGE